MRTSTRIGGGTDHPDAHADPMAAPEPPGGPEITFHAEVPTAGTYRLFLDFRHAGTVHTAEFTATTDHD